MIVVASTTFFIALRELEEPAKSGYRAQVFYFQTKSGLTADQQRVLEEFNERFRVTFVGRQDGPYKLAIANYVGEMSGLELLRAFIATNAVDVVIPEHSGEKLNESPTASMSMKK